MKMDIPLTDAQLAEGLVENGHQDVAQALVDKIDADRSGRNTDTQQGTGQPPSSMSDMIRNATGRA